MKRISLFTILVFLAGLAIGYFARGDVALALQQKDAHAADLAAIEKLHQKDIEVTLAQDPQGLLDIWTEDAVRFIAGNPPAVGKQAIAAENDKAHSQFPGFKVLSYAAHYGNPQIEDGMACEWGEHDAQFRMSPDTPPGTWHGKGFHVLRRQSDGSWRFVVLIMSQ